MPGGRRGLLAPQNTFLDSVIKKADEQNVSFIVSNARVVDFPIVYSNELFTKQTGFLRTEVSSKPAFLRFMQGEYTDPEKFARIQTAYEEIKRDQFDILLYKKNKTALWFCVTINPVPNETGEVVLFLLTLKDVTSTKLPSEDDGTKGVGRIAKLARTVTRVRSASQNGSNNHSISPHVESFSPKSNKASLTNGNELPRYMLEPPKTPPRIILHYSSLKTTWDWTILVLTFHTAIMVPYKLTFLKDVQRDLGNPNQLVLFITDTLIDVAFFIDVLLNFHTTYVGAMEEVISDPKLIRWNYLKSWFVIDTLSCVPYDVFDLLAFSSQSAGQSTGVADAFSTLKIIRLSVRVWRVARKKDHYLEYGGAQLIIFMCGFLLAAHWFACGWYIIGHFETSLNYGWLQQLSVDFGEDFTVEGSNHEYKIRSEDISTVYISSLYYTISSMTSIGFGNIAANTNIEKVFTIFMMIVGALLYAAIFGNVTTIVQQLYSSSARYHEMLNNIREFMKLHQVPKELSERVMDYVVSSWAATKGINSDKVLSYCPKDMKADLCVHMNRQILRRHQAFRLASDGCLRSLAVHFEMAHSAPGDLIYHTGESIDYLCFIVSGSLEVIQDNEVTGLLGVGDVFGDAFWRESTLGQSTANVRALTYCDIHMIKREHLLDVLQFYQNFGNAFARNIQLTYNLRVRKRQKKFTDVLKEKAEEERRKLEPLQEIPMNHPVRKLFNKLKRPADDVSKSSGGGATTLGGGAGVGDNLINDVKRDQQMDMTTVSAVLNQERSIKSAWSMHFEKNGDKTRSRKTGQFYDEESSPADNFVKNKASKWTKTLSVNSISSIDANPEPSGQIKTFSALVKAAASNQSIVSAAAAAATAGSPSGDQGPPSKDQHQHPQNDTSSTSGVPGNPGPQISVSRDALQNIFNVRSNLKQQVNNINSDLDALDSLLAQLLMSAATNQKSKEFKSSNLDSNSEPQSPPSSQVNPPSTLSHKPKTENVPQTTQNQPTTHTDPNPTPKT